MARNTSEKLTWSDVTPERLFLDRRRFISGSGALALGAMGGVSPALAASRYSTSEAPNTLKQITHYNNYYEFGTGKEDPAKHAGALTVKPWTVRIDGMVDKPGDYGLEDILAHVTPEERIYRLRCVEAWSMVIPWTGFELNKLLGRVGVQSGARYVAFQTLLRPKEMPGQRRSVLAWPYREGLRLDEAMHPLTILATGLYGKNLPKQNGAPLRLVVPWKYGYKSIKAIVRITLTDKQPQTSWNMEAPNEYGFYSNVNPHVSHPRWSQASERRIGSGFLAKRIKTLMFNGYGDQVASLYAGMDLKKYH